MRKLCLGDTDDVNRIIYAEEDTAEWLGRTDRTIFRVCPGVFINNLFVWIILLNSLHFSPLMSFHRDIETLRVYREIPTRRYRHQQDFRNTENYL